MKRTIVPEQRKRFLQENINLNIKEKNNALLVNVLLCNLQQENYQDNAKIILEAYNRINIERLQLGDIKNYKEEVQSHPLLFEVPIRAKINFRLKIIDPDSFRLLGYAENLKEEKYSKSLLDINTSDENVKNIYRIDFENPDHPVLYLNPQLAQCANQLKPVLAEMAFKDILNYLLFHSEEIFKEHKWFIFAEKICEYDEGKFEGEGSFEDKKLDWINKVLCKFSENKNLVKLITNGFQEND